MDVEPALFEYLSATERYIWITLSNDLTAVLDMEGCFDEANPAWERTTGYSPQRLAGSYLLEFIHMEDRERTLAQLQSLVTSDIASSQINFRFRCRGGVFRDLNWNVIFSPGHNRYFCVARDVTGPRTRDDMAYQDALTGLCNRLFLDDHFPRILESADQERRPVAVLFLDLDGFKAVNDTLGHRAGDLLLREVARRMHAVAAPEDFALARIGGDEFVAVGAADRNRAMDMAEALVRTVSRPCRLGGCDVAVSASVGISLYPDHGSTPGDLMDRADTAMYTVKQSGKASWAFAGPAD
ncbi:diguanylate cyclase domain-containing protein [Desulfocurvus sp. DL9XJH121]